MTITFTIADVRRRARRMPDGYYDAVMQRAKHVGDGRYVLPDEAYRELRDKFAPRPRPTAASAMTFAEAAILGKYVSDEVREEREAICATCPYSKVDARGRYCNICGCGVSSEERQIRNLAAYEENPPNWGCKHPQRSEGHGWKR